MGMKVQKEIKVIQEPEELEAIGYLLNQALYLQLRLMDPEVGILLLALILHLLVGF